MNRLQAKLRKTSDERSKIMLEACIKLLTSFGAKNRAEPDALGNDRATLAKNIQSVATTAEDIHLRSDAVMTKVNSLIGQCLEVDPEDDSDDEGEAAIVLVNVHAGLEEAKEMLAQLNKAGVELVAVLTSVFDGLHGHHLDTETSPPVIHRRSADVDKMDKGDVIPREHTISPVAEQEQQQDDEVSSESVCLETDDVKLTGW